MMKNKYDYIIPIGTDCLTAEALNSLKIRIESLPFDWLYHSSNEFFVSAMNCILNDFKTFFNFTDLKIIGKCEEHNTWRCYNKRTGFHHIHDFPLKSNYIFDFIKVKRKYERRTARLLNILNSKKKILLVYMEQYCTADNIFQEYISKLCEKFQTSDIHLLVLQHNENMQENESQTTELNSNIIKVVYNNGYEFSPKKDDSWWRNQKQYLKILSDNIDTGVKVSVVLPTYNAEMHLKESIDSLLLQTMKNFEILIIDDNSTDSTREIINSYTDKRIRLIDGPCKGLAAALNKGIEEAKGEYVARMDADDISLPNRFEEQCKFLDFHKDISLLGTWQQHFGKSNFKHCPPPEPDIAKITLMLGCEMCHSTVMFRREDFIKNHLFYPEKSPQEDYELWSKAIGYINVANLPIVLGKYRVSEESITNDKLDILDEYEAKLAQKNLKMYLDINLSDNDIILVQKRNNPYWEMDRKQKKEYQKRLNNLYKLIEKKNRKYKFVNPAKIVQALSHNWNIMCGEKYYINTKYNLYRNNILKTIFSITNSVNKTHKIITIFGVKLKIKRK